jgi:predicted amidohydrolase
LNGEAVDRLAQLSTDLGLTIISGLYERGDSSRPFNTVVAVSPHQGVVAKHRKTHLFDAWGYRESDEVSFGNGAVSAFHLSDGFTIGLVNCYEIRFPERAYSLALAGADLIAVSAAWPRGPHREDHWTLNIRARAIENTVWVAAAGASGPDLVGRSTIADPLGVVRAQLAENAGIAIQEIDLARIQQARESLPVLQQRRERYVSPVPDAPLGADAR